MRITLPICLLFCITPWRSQTQIPDWTWLYKHTPPIKPSKTIEHSAQTPLFNQLIFSWNALRPTQGHFSFWASVRNAKTKKWYSWHKMIVWGKRIQRSFLDKTVLGTSYHHVRLELPKDTLADAFKIHVYGHNKASLNLVKTLFINVVNLTEFQKETSESLEDLRSVYIPQVPRYSQMVLNHERAEHMCSPTSTTMLVNYTARKYLRPLDVALKAYDSGLDAYGSWPFNTACAFELSKGKISYHVERLASFRQLHALLYNKIPVVVSVRGPLTGSATAYANGHLLVVVGYDKKSKKVIVHDPAFEANNRVMVTYNLNDFLSAWERSRRIAYVAEP